MMLAIGKWIAVPLLAATLAAANVRVVHFAGGQAIIVQHDSYEEVTIKGRRGEVTSVSACDSSSGTYDQIVQFQQALKSAARRGDRKAVVSLMRFPLGVNTMPGKGYDVPSRISLIRHFGRVFPTRMLRTLGDIEPHDVFCRDGMSMIAGGVIWAQVRNGGLRGVVVNAQP